MKSRVKAPQKLCRPRRQYPSTSHAKSPKERKSWATGGIEIQSLGQAHFRENIGNEENRGDPILGRQHFF